MKSNLKVQQVTKDGQAQPLVTTLSDKNGRPYDMFKAYLVGKVRSGIKMSDWAGIVTRFGKVGDFDHITVGTMLPVEQVGQLVSSSPFYANQKDLNGLYYARGVQFEGESPEAMFTDAERNHAVEHAPHQAPTQTVA